MTNLENGPNDTDYQRALQLLLFTHDGVDIYGVNHVFDQIGEHERGGQTILALCEVTQMVIREAARIHPDLHDELVATMRKTLVQYELNQLKGTDDE